MSTLRSDMHKLLCPVAEKRLKCRSWKTQRSDAQIRPSPFWVLNLGLLNPCKSLVCNRLAAFWLLITMLLSRKASRFQGHYAAIFIELKSRFAFLTRRLLICAYSGFSSVPNYFLLFASAPSPVVSAPLNGSSTMSPSFLPVRLAAISAFSGRLCLMKMRDLQRTR